MADDYKDTWELLEEQLSGPVQLEWNPPGPVVLAIDSEKGGVGKSGLAGGLVAVMAAHGRRVLGIDLDPRATFTEELGVAELEDNQFSVNDLLYVDPKTPLEELPELSGQAQDALLDAGDEWGPNVKVLAAERALANREFDPSSNLEHRLRVALEGVAEQFDLVVIDMPPRAGGKLVGAGLLAATHVIFPGTLDRDGFVGIKDARRTFTIMQQTNSRKVVDVGIVRNIVDRKTEIGRAFDSEFAETFGEKMLPVVVPRRVIRIESRTACVPVTVSSSQGAKDVINGYTSVLNYIGKAA